MSAWLIAVVGVVYAVVAVDLIVKGNTGLGIALMLRIKTKLMLSLKPVRRGIG